MPEDAEAIKTELRAIAEIVAKAVGPDLGFALFLPVAGRLTYVSNANREDMVKSLSEWLRRTKPTSWSRVDDEREDPERGKWGRSFSSGESPRQVETRLSLEEHCASIGKKIGERIKLTLFVLNFGDGGNLAYYTNMERSREGVAEWLESQKAR